MQDRRLIWLLSCFLPSDHRGLLSVPGTHQVYSCFRAFALIIPFIWNASSQSSQGWLFSFLFHHSELGSNVFFSETLFLTPHLVAATLSPSQCFCVCSCSFAFVQNISHALKLPFLFVCLAVPSPHPMDINSMRARSCFSYHHIPNAKNSMSL